MVERRETLYLAGACDDGADDDADILHGKLEKMTAEKGEDGADDDEDILHNKLEKMTEEKVEARGRYC